MKYVYHAVLSPSDDSSGFVAAVPDLPGCVTTGADLAEAIDMITDAASLWLVSAEDHGYSIPPASPQTDIPHSPGSLFTILRLDTFSYRAATDTRAVRKNVSLPAWLASMADSRNINCSQVLQDGLKSILS